MRFPPLGQRGPHPGKQPVSLQFTSGSGGRTSFLYEGGIRMNFDRNKVEMVKKRYLFWYTKVITEGLDKV